MFIDISLAFRGFSSNEIYYTPQMCITNAFCIIGRENKQHKMWKKKVVKAIDLLFLFFSPPLFCSLVLRINIVKGTHLLV
jgi:hypothetical protein